MNKNVLLGIIFLAAGIALVFSSATAQTKALVPASSAGI